MSLERRIAFVSLAVGVVLAAWAVIGCEGNEDSGAMEEFAGCEYGDSLPVAAARLAEAGRSVRFVYAGAEPCMFGMDVQRAASPSSCAPTQSSVMSIASRRCPAVARSVV